MIINNIIKTLILLVVFAAAALFTSAGMGNAAQGRNSSHMNKLINIEGCSACHKGRGVSGGGLLRAKSGKLCYSCHSINATGKGRAATDIESVMRKQSRHPVEDTAYLHRKFEVLPAKSSMAQRHVACDDCHVSHVTSPGKAWNGVPGYRPGIVRGKGGNPKGLYMKLAELEYEICYRCHSDGANTGAEARDISMELDPSNMSYHPVEVSGRNKNVPSLVDGLSETSVIKCGSCHGNSDPNGAKGPHGSDFSPLLVAEYRTTDGPESSMSYTLCYICHDRQSILGDQSFKSHRFHVVLNHLSCNNCHTSHGSALNSHLIEFGAGITNSSDGMGPIYQLGTPGMPHCFLNCHGVDHNASDVNGKAWPW